MAVILHSPTVPAVLNPSECAHPTRWTVASNPIAARSHRAERLEPPVRVSEPHRWLAHRPPEGMEIEPWFPSFVRYQTLSAAV